MQITPKLFEAYLKCPTKCWLRAAGEPTAGNAYAEWVQSQNESYRSDAVSRLKADTPADKCAVDPTADTLKTAQWRLALDVPVQIQFRSSRGNEAQTSSPPSTKRNLKSNDQSLVTSAATDQGGASPPEFIIESRLHAIERIPSEGRGKASQFIPIRFIFRNKLTKDDKLLLAFDALVLSEVIGREVSLGKIIHGDNHATLNVKLGARTAESARTPATSKGLTGEVRKCIEKIAGLFADPTKARNAESHVREPASGGDETRGLGGPRSDHDASGFTGNLSRLYSSRKRALLKGHCSGDFTKPALTGFDSM